MRTKFTRSKTSSLLATRSRQMKFALTESEQRLWLSLRAPQILGVRFRRQVPIAGRYIVDFLAVSQRLVVEVDGGYHSSRRGADARRDERLRRLGSRVLRLDAELVTRNLPEALAQVRAALGELP